MHFTAKLTIKNIFNFCAVATHQSLDLVLLVAKVNSIFLFGWTDIYNTCLSDGLSPTISLT